MTNQQKLEYIIQKAIDGGWWNEISSVTWHDPNDPQELVDLHFKRGFSQIGINIEAVIYRKDFAKALWGEKGVHGKPILSSDKGALIAHLKNYEYHLQQAVISDDPINYIYESIKEQI